MKDVLISELRLACRALLKSPSFSAGVVLTLALGIGANSAIFSVVNTVVLRALPYPEADRLVMIWGTDLGQSDRDAVRPSIFHYWRENVDSFEGMAGVSLVAATLLSAGDPEQVRLASVTRNFFETLRVRPSVGSTFADNQESSNSVILGYGLWQRRFGGDAAIIGQGVSLSGELFTVVGVAPGELDLPAKTDAWVLAPQDYPHRRLAEPPQKSAGTPYIRVIGRLAEGTTLQQASSEMDAISKRIGEMAPQIADRGVNLVPLHEQTVGQVRPALQILLAAAGLLLLVACANAANLLYARGIRREREIAARMALGANRLQLVRLMMTEGLVLALAAGALGLLLSYLGLRFLLSLDAGNIPRFQEVGLDARVWVFTVGLSLLIGCIFGLLPVLQARRADLAGALKEAARGTVSRRGAAYRLFLVSQVALAVVLLVGTGLLLRSFMRLQSVNPGFEASGLLTFRVALEGQRYATSAQQAAFFQDLVERLNAIPGADSAASVFNLPFPGSFVGGSIYIEGKPIPPASERNREMWQSASPGYFSAMKIPLLLGRDFTARDSADAPLVAIVTESIAARYFPDEDPLGQRLSIRNPQERSPQWRTVVGVAGDVKHTSLEKGVRGEVFFPHPQWPWIFMYPVLRTQGEPLDLVPAVRRAVAEIDPELPILDVKTMQQRLDESKANPRFTLSLVVIFAALAALLAAVGIYSTGSYTLNQRRPEIGLRMALGALQQEILAQSLRQGLLLTLLGVGVGLLGAFALTRLLEMNLFEVSAADPLTYLGASVFAMAISVLANLIPAYRASRIDPLTVLRYE